MTRRPSRALCISGVAVLVSLGVSESAHAGLFGRIRDKIRQRVDNRVDKLRDRLDTLRDIAPDRPCAKEFRELLKQALDARRRCLDDAPPGSPIDKFEKLSRREAEDFCGRRGDAECLDFVLDEQEKFCEQKTDGLVAKVIAKRAECTQENAKRFAGKVRDRVRSRVDGIVDLVRKELDTLKDIAPDRQCAKDFRAALKDVLDARRQCLSDAPAGSPIDRFEKFSRAQEDAYCGSRGDNDCLAFLLDDQEKFCRQRTEALVRKAIDKRTECSKEAVKEAVKRFGGKVRDRLRSGLIAKSLDGFRQGIGTLADALRDRPCAQEFRAALKDAVEARRACLEDAPPGSPIDRFEKFSPREEDAYCGSRGDNDCLAFLLQDQEKFCNQRTEALAKKAIEKRLACK